VAAVHTNWMLCPCCILVLLDAGGPAGPARGGPHSMGAGMRPMRHLRVNASTPTWLVAVHSSDWSAWKETGGPATHMKA